VVVGNISAPQVRNAIRRILRAQVGGKLSRSDKSAIWQYFENRCAYCGKTLDPTSRAGHIDHLVPTSLGGSDHISNRVLACGVCNGDDKREADWRHFLCATAGTSVEYELRLQRIEGWVAAQRSTAPIVSAELHDLVETHIELVLQAFDKSLRAIREKR